MSSSSIHHYGLIFLFVAVALFSVSSAAQFKPKSFLFSIRKDTKTLQYYTSLEISTRGNYVPLVIDLDGTNTWFDCDAYKLPTYKPLLCDSKNCKQYNGHGGGCFYCSNSEPQTKGCKDTGVLESFNDFSFSHEYQILGEDGLFVVDTNGVAVGITYESPKPFAFTCSIHPDLMKGLSNETKGMLGLANKPTASFHTQLSKQFKKPHKFAVCLPSASEYALGHMFIGGGPYYFLPYNKDISKQLLTTPLLNVTYDAFDDLSYEYYINATYINVDHKPVSFNHSFLSFNETRRGGTVFSTTTPYTQLETSIYKGLVTAFTKAAAFRKMKRVASVAPFGACYESKSISRSQTGPVVPYIDIGLVGNTQWRFYGANSMVAVNKDVLCLAYVDGGTFDPQADEDVPIAKYAIVIGGYQMENYLLEFDLVSSTLGISTSLLFRNTTCSQSRVM